MNRRTALALAILLATFSGISLSAADWAQFRGPGGSASSDETNLPTEWSETKNLKWKTELPGAGASSAIVVGDRVFLTCYSGYGVGRERGTPEDLRRHLVCVNRPDGKILWTSAVEPVLPEDPFTGMGVPEHGYATSTPVSDGERVYVFFGKTGVLAFDFDGKQLWQTSLGTESGRMRWGSGASPILYKNLVIVNASDESESLRALDKKTGEEVWKAQASGLASCWGTPILVETGDHTELVIAVAYEIWGFNPDNGKLLWYAESGMDSNVSPSVVAQDGIVYGIGGRQGGAAAVRVGGKDDVSASHVLWKSRSTSYVPSPVLYEDHLYWVDDRGLAFCVNAKDGQRVYQERLSGLSGSGGFGGRPFYASVVVAGGNLYAVSRTSGTFVIAAKPEFELIARNEFDDNSDFNASPAISDGQIFLRSNRFLYCLEKSAAQ